MGKMKFTVRVDAAAFETAKQFAGKHGTTVTSLVEEFFRSLGKLSELSMDTPILNELAGSLRADITQDDYRAYLEEKYLGDAGKSR